MVITDAKTEEYWDMIFAQRRISMFTNARDKLWDDIRNTNVNNEALVAAHKELYNAFNKAIDAEAKFLTELSMPVQQ